MRCKELRRLTPDAVRQPADTLPVPVQEHLGECPECRRWLEVARVAAGLVRIAGEAAEVPEGFARQVMALLPRRSQQPSTADIWRPAWGLIPAFTAAAVALLFVYQTSLAAPVGLVPLEELSAGEQLVLQGTTLEPDQVLGAVLGGEVP